MAGWPTTLRTGLARAVDAAEAALATRVAGGILVALACAWYLYQYSVIPLLPTTAADGWFGWWDQSHYLREAVALRGLALGPDVYWYPLGYPGLGALFLDVLPVDAFLVPDLVMFLLATVLFWRVARLGLSRVGSAVAAAAALLLLHDELVLAFVIPWNTIPVHVVSWWLAWQALAARRIGPWRAVGLGAAVGFAYLCRQVDAVLLGPPLLAILWLDGAPPRRVGLLLRAGLVAALFPAIAHLVSYRVHGSFLTPYEAGESACGFFGHDLLAKAFSVLVDGRAVDGTDRAVLLGRMPWLIATPVAVAFASRRFGARAWVAMFSPVVGAAVYLVYNGSLPAGLYGWLQVQHLAGMLVLMLLFVVFLAGDLAAGARGRPVRTVAVLAGVAAAYLLLASVRLDAVDRTDVVIAADGTLMASRREADRPFDVLQLPASAGEKGEAVLTFHGEPARRFQDMTCTWGRCWMNGPTRLADVRATTRLEGGPAPYVARLKWGFEPSLRLGPPAPEVP